VILADHGEEFFEHGNVGHGHTTRRVLTHIPCMVRWPNGLPKGKRIRADVELMDFFPTVIDMAGGAIPSTVQGESLVALMADPAPGIPRPAFTFHGGVRALKMDRWKYVLLSNKERLYDLDEDPNERTDVAADNPLALRLMRETMAVHFALNTKWKKREHGHPNSPTAAGATLILTP
jgi:arylsulfatase A-like enzyme